MGEGFLRIAGDLYPPPQLSIKTCEHTSSVRLFFECPSCAATVEDLLPARDRPLTCLPATSGLDDRHLAADDCEDDPELVFNRENRREQSASLVASFAPCEQQLISQRTRQALARTRAQGVRLGRPPTMSAYAIERIRNERAAGNSLAAIANGLNTDHVPTAQGGRRWYPATIRHTLNRTS